MSTSFWMTTVWLGAAVFILFLPYILSTWTGFAIALGLSVVAIWKAFAPKRSQGKDGESKSVGQ